MKKVQRFECEYCHKEFREADICERHEKSHAEPESTVKEEYVWKYLEDAGYYAPEIIRIKCKNGAVIEYRNPSFKEIVDVQEVQE